MVALGRSETSRLARSMMKDAALVSALHASCFTARDRGLAMLSFTLPAESLREAVREASEQLFRLRAEELAPDELERACRQLEGNALRERELAQARAQRLGLYLCNTEGLEQEQLYFTRLQALTPGLVREAAQRWFEPRELVGAALLPLAEEEAFDFQAFQELLEELAAVAGVEELPAPGPQGAAPARARPARRVGIGEAAPMIREELPGGGVLLIREERAVPLVAMHASWSGGQRAETVAEGGARSMLARLAAKETALRGAGQLARELEALGGSLEGSVGRDAFSLGAEALAPQFASAWALFAEALAAPAFRPAEVERGRDQQQDELRGRDADTRRRRVPALLRDALPQAPLPARGAGKPAEPGQARRSEARGAARAALSRGRRGDRGGRRRQSRGGARAGAREPGREPGRAGASGRRARAAAERPAGRRARARACAGPPRRRLPGPLPRQPRQRGARAVGGPALRTARPARPRLPQSGDRRPRRSRPLDGRDRSGLGRGARRVRPQASQRGARVRPRAARAAAGAAPRRARARARAEPADHERRAPPAARTGARGAARLR